MAHFDLQRGTMARMKRSNVVLFARVGLMRVAEMNARTEEGTTTMVARKCRIMRIPAGIRIILHLRATIVWCLPLSLRSFLQPASGLRGRIRPRWIASFLQIKVCHLLLRPRLIIVIINGTCEAAASRRLSTFHWQDMSETKNT
jgi:hypothetical protein